MNIIEENQINYDTLDTLIAESIIDYCDLNLDTEPALLMSNKTLHKLEQDLINKKFGVNFYIKNITQDDMTPYYHGMKIAIANWLIEGEVEIR